MTGPAVIKATYADIKTVRTRKVFQIVFEGPIEQMEGAMAMLGAPMPDREVWVAIARLQEGDEVIRGGKLAQQAGIIGAQGAFQQWIGVKDPEAAAEFIRTHCGVLSRKSLDSNDAAGRKFMDLKADYEIWLREAA